MALIFVRPRRSATIRTRLGVQEIRQQLDAIARAPEPDGMGRLLAHGFFKGGSVGTNDFHLDYHYNAHKNPQTYDVHGSIAETPDWRIVRLKLRAHDPWMHPWVLAFVALLVAIPVAIEGERVGPGLFVLAFVTVIYAFANLLYIPDVVTNRVSSLLASELRGSVRHGSQWVVPAE